MSHYSVSMSSTPGRFKSGTWFADTLTRKMVRLSDASDHFISDSRPSDTSL